MTEMNVAARKGRMLRALFEALKAEPEGLAAKDAISATRAKITLLPQEEGVFEESGAEKFPHLLRFSTITVVKAGWMAKNEGVWSVTEAGLKAYEDYPEPEGFSKEARKLYRAWRKAAAPQVDDQDESEEAVKSAVSLEETEDAARQEILDYIARMSPFEFQRACANLVEGLGHEIRWISDPGPDGGIDFVAYADPIGAGGRRIKGQAKRQQKKQDVDDVGAFMSKLKADDVGVFVAVGGFTKNAEATARADERRTVLIDGADFVRLWIEHYSELDESARSLLRLKQIWHLAPSTA